MTANLEDALRRRPKPTEQRFETPKTHRCDASIAFAALYQRRENGGTANSLLKDHPEMMEMFIASVDFGESDWDQDGDGNFPDESIIVPHPKRHRPALQQAATSESAAVAPSDAIMPTDALEVSRSQATARALQIDNARATSELKERSRELVRSKLSLRAKDKEIQELRASLAGRDRQLKYSKAELMENRSALAEKDRQLEEMCQNMYIAAKERSSLREDLLMVEKELQETRDELQSMASTNRDLREMLEADELNGSTDLLLSDTAGGAPSRAGNDQPGSAKAKTPTARGALGKGDEAGHALTLLGRLAKLSQQLAADAREDEKMKAKRPANED
eukprot:evm.model.scf_2655.3 EVM.evm.TU.scf_2655.3   scf_2655:9907-12686(-)